MIIVTGGAGFIGSNLVHALNDMGRNDIIVVDDLTDGRKFRNLVGCDILDYVDKEDFLDFIEQSGNFSSHVDVIFHQGACSTTTEWDGRKMMHHNYDYSKVMLHYALQHEIPFIYASSAAVYGDGKKGFREARKTENPLNVYGYSKWQFDQYVRSHVGHPESQVVGLRYFNVYGPREAHKDSMASVCYHFDKQCTESGTIKLFEGSDGFDAGEQLRDFVHVSDVVAVNLWFWQNPEKMGLYNVGTGEARTFNALAEAVKDYHGRGEIEYIPFPETLAGSYQSYTEADISRLREAGYEAQFLSLEQGVRSYLDWLH